MNIRTCTACGETKPLDQFYTSRGKPNGKCKPCFRAAQKTGMMLPPKLPAPEGMKRCMTCKKILAETEFCKYAGYHDGLDRICKECRYRRHREWADNHRPQLNEAQKRRYRSDPARYAEYERKQHYGMARGEYAQMLAAQGGRCAICGTDNPAPRKHFAVDHCHTNGTIRGLLCGHCNSGIGYLKHSPQILASAIEYLSSKDISPKGSGI